MAVYTFVVGQRQVAHSSVEESDEHNMQAKEWCLKDPLKRSVRVQSDREGIAYAITSSSHFC